VSILLHITKICNLACSVVILSHAVSCFNTANTSLDCEPILGVKYKNGQKEEALLHRLDFPLKIYILHTLLISYKNSNILTPLPLYKNVFHI